MPMEVRVCEEVAAPAAKAWAVMRGFGDVAQWMQGLESCELSGSGVGAVRTLTMPGGLRIQERLEAFDDAGRSFSYAIVGNSPLPLRDYLSTVKIRETGPGSCEVAWDGRFEPNPGSEGSMQRMVRGIYTNGIAALRKKLGV
jgi:carbon monoxide dehydrogenase subunit G